MLKENNHELSLILILHFYWVTWLTKLIWMVKQNLKRVCSYVNKLVIFLHLGCWIKKISKTNWDYKQYNIVYLNNYVNAFFCDSCLYEGSDIAYHICLVTSIKWKILKLNFSSTIHYHWYLNIWIGYCKNCKRKF